MSISLNFKNTPTELINKVRDEITQNNGSFNGDEKEGTISINSFLGQISGDYKIINNTIKINITQKPFFVTENKIKDELKKYL